MMTIKNKKKLTYVTIDVWARQNFKNIVRAIKWELKINGFTWIDNGPEIYEPDTKYFHVPINFYIESSQLINQTPSKIMN